MIDGAGTGHVDAGLIGENSGVDLLSGTGSAAFEVVDIDGALFLAWGVVVSAIV